jgi:hypothetical protein
MRIQLLGGMASGRVIDVADPPPASVTVPVAHSRPTLPDNYCGPVPELPTTETYLPSEEISTSGFPVWTVAVNTVVSVAGVGAQGQA